MHKKGMLLTAFMVWIMAGASAYALGLEVAAGAWRQDPGGEFGYKAVTPDDLLHVEDELRYGRETRLHGRAKIDLPLPLPNIYLAAAPSEFEGDGFKNTPFRFGDRIFPADVPFYSRLKFDQYDIALYYGLPFLRTATMNRLNIDVGINVRLIDVEAEILESQTGIAEKEDAFAPIPLLYVGVQLVLLERLALEAEGRGLAIGSDSLYSLIGRVRFTVAGPVFIAGGYRYDRVDVDEDDIKVDMTVQGPFVEVGLTF
jgi:outer membrane protein